MQKVIAFNCTFDLLANDQDQRSNPAPIVATSITLQAKTPLLGTCMVGGFALKLFHPLLA